jgi:ATP-dependent Clp protease ATP-binding subunit ClpA
MFERYTEQALRILFLGRIEAGQRGSPFIGVEHLLLASLREDKLLFSLLPDGAAEAIRQQIEAVAPHFESPANLYGDLPLSEDAKQALVLGAEEAEHLGDRAIEASYLLLGMLRLETGTAASILQPYGIDLAGYRQAARSFLLGG